MDSYDRRLLDQLAASTGLSRAEIMRQGLRSFAAQRGGSAGPMQSFMNSLRENPMTADLASDHDEHLARIYRDRTTRD